MSDQTEEKVLPPSEHKLRKAREKGQVASSADFVSMLSTVGGIAFLLLTWRQIFDMFDRLFLNVVLAFKDPSDSEIMGLLLTTILESVYLLAPLAALMIMIGLVANMLHKGGIPFSLHPLKPEFKKINPAEGMKKLFSKRNAAEIGVSFVRLVLWFAVCSTFMWMSISAIFNGVNCSLGCVVDQGYNLGILIVLAAMIFLLAGGLIDLPMQMALFSHEQKMGHKEFKREHKDINGSPEFKHHRKNEHQRLISAGSGPSRPGVDGPNTTGIAVGSAAGITGAIGQVSMLMNGGDTLIGIYYHPVHSPVPEVVFRVRGTQVAERMREGLKLGVPVVVDPELVGEVYRSIDLGGIIRERHFERVANKMIEADVISV